jgi:hypothetical protein
MLIPLTTTDFLTRGATVYMMGPVVAAAGRERS